MSGIGEFVISFCAASVLLGALFMLVPSGTLSNTVKYLLCLIYLCCILSSTLGVKRFSPDFDFAKPGSSIPENSVVLAAKATFEQALKTNDIEFSEIRVLTDISADGGISLNEVIIFTSAAPEKIRDVLGESDEYEVTVINE